MCWAWAGRYISRPTTRRCSTGRREQLSAEGWELHELTHDLHANGAVGVMTDYEAKFYEAGQKINRLVARCTESTKNGVDGVVARLRNASLTDARGYASSAAGQCGGGNGASMRFISWNVNGLRAVLKKGFEDIFWSLDADFFCLQETKLQAGQVELDLPGYESYWCYAERKGYSGTAIFTKHTPLSVSYNLGLPEHDTEGRVITLEYDNFYLVCVYTPNAQDGLKRIDYRMSWEDAFRDYLVGLDAKKPVIVCGDMNVAHNEIDLKNPKTNIGNPGFSFEERGKFTELLDAGFTDSFRYLYPDKTDAYSWWSYRAAARERNVGWRIDYFVVSDRLREKIKDAYILPEITGLRPLPRRAGCYMVKIGSVEITGRFTLAPMAGVSDFAFRAVCREQGAALTTTEMVSAKALVYKDEKTKSLLYVPPEEHPCAVQIFGHEPEIMAEAAGMALGYSGAGYPRYKYGLPCREGRQIRRRLGADEVAGACGADNRGRRGRGG